MTMILKTCTYGNPILSEKSTVIEKIDDEIRKLANDMKETMYDQNGLGLAAQQVGRTERICIVDIPPEMNEDEQGNRLNPDVDMPMILLNPKMTEASSQTSGREEGCLSFPEIYGNVTRPAEIVLSYMTLEGKQVDGLALKGMVARAVQHELDHLKGVVFIEHLSYVKKMALKGKLKRLKRDTLEKLA